MSMYLGQSVFSPRQDKDQLAHALYNPGAATQSNIYGSAIPAVSGLPAGMQGLSIHSAGSRSLGSASQFGVSRANTAPAGYGAMQGLGGVSALGAPSPQAARGGMLPLGSTRAGLIGASQGMIGGKPSRPSTLSQAIGSALPMSSLGRSAAGMMSPMSSAYGPSLSDASSQGFDPVVDFPMLSLVSRGRHDSTGSLTAASVALPARPGAPGQLSKPAESVPGFQMHSEDFPALPGSSTKSSDLSELPQDGRLNVSALTGMPVSSASEGRAYDLAPGSNKERSILTAPIGPPKAKKSTQPSSVSIPAGMVQDQFGMMGLLTFIRGAESDPNLVALALGSDLTTLGLNLNSPESLYNTFASPWAEAPCRPQDIDYNVPQEYLIHPYIRDKLAPIRLNRYHEDLLFYLYYSNGGDLLQLLAAGELYARDWRYHKEERLWITRAPGMKPTKQEPTYEEGTYCYFDMNTWRKAHKEFHVEYDKLEDRPQLPPNVLAYSGLASYPVQS